MCLAKSTETYIKEILFERFLYEIERVISDVRVTWERVSQKLNILTAWRRGPRVAMG